MGKSNITRGKKWLKVREQYVFEEKDKDVAWLDNQKAIVNDIKEYEESLNPVKETKSKGKK